MATVAARNARQCPRSFGRIGCPAGPCQRCVSGIWRTRVTSLRPDRTSDEEFDCAAGWSLWQQRSVAVGTTGRLDVLEFSRQQARHCICKRSSLVEWQFAGQNQCLNDRAGERVRRRRLSTEACQQPLINNRLLTGDASDGTSVADPQGTVDTGPPNSRSRRHSGHLLLPVPAVRHATTQSDQEPR
jgi:hypothetical protein